MEDIPSTFSAGSSESSTPQNDAKNLSLLSLAAFSTQDVVSQPSSSPSVIESPFNSTLRFSPATSSSSPSMEVGGNNSSLFVQDKPSLVRAAPGKWCRNCGAVESTSWRRDPLKTTILCNSCGLHLKIHGRHKETTQEQKAIVMYFNGAYNRRRSFIPIVAPAKTSVPESIPQTQGFKERDQYGRSFSANSGIQSSTPIQSHLTYAPIPSNSNSQSHSNQFQTYSNSYQVPNHPNSNLVQSYPPMQTSSLIQSYPTLPLQNSSMQKLRVPSTFQNHSYLPMQHNQMSSPFQQSPQNFGPAQNFQNNVVNIINNNNSSKIVSAGQGYTTAASNLHPLSLPTAIGKSTNLITFKSNDGVMISVPSKWCTNCGATTTTSWRRDPSRKFLLCNACGLHLKIHKRNRTSTKSQQETVSYYEGIARKHNMGGNGVMSATSSNNFRKESRMQLVPETLLQESPSSRSSMPPDVQKGINNTTNGMMVRERWSHPTGSNLTSQIQLPVIFNGGADLKNNSNPNGEISKDQKQESTIGRNINSILN